ncbi:MarR family winged helix-turn-helix transcriptional regulator [uncultured Methanobrevibacter sp.]|uniref:MarR family winged helix-turn-helix transcriptional regulator n=1 Tax=uncultured Methanobrevibacter sp. TaxID=253161 RepID=UPI0025D76926|nr:MarR family transcriptional regulator [uncultured Methanobrevibacter sp.]
MEFNTKMPTTPFVSLIYRSHAKYLNKKMQSVNLTFGLYPFLIEIYNNEGISQEDLAKILYLNESTVTRNLEKLEKRGLIVRTPNKRKKIINITDEGREIAKMVMDYDEKWDEIIKKDLNEEEYNNFKKTLIKIGEGLV